MAKLYCSEKTIGFFLCCLAFSSCANYKNITYFRSISDSSYMYEKGEDIPLASFHSPLIEPDDILSITVSTLDPAINGALNVSAPTTAANLGDMAILSASTSSPASENEPAGYLVDKDGNIEVPVLGKFHVSGLTTTAIKDLVAAKAVKLFKDPVINVRLVNFKVTVLGEVARPGTYIINGEKASVVDALGMAGDMTIFGKRDNLLLARTVGDSKKMVRFNLNDPKVFASPYFYLRQGDLLYVEPSKGKAVATDASVARNYAIFGTVASLLIVILSRIHF
jgi:polysaccharide export outer membrane protein